MKVMQHGPHFWQLTQWGLINMFLVGEVDGLTLIDTGFSGAAGGILDAIATIGRPLRRITLTHAHGDHTGSLDQLGEALFDRDVEIALPDRTADFLQGQLDLLPKEPQTPLKGSFMRRERTATRRLQHDEKLGSLRVVAAPGHTPDHVAYFDERDGTLIAGDAFQTLGGTAVAGVVRLLFPFPAMATWHPPTALASARTLRDLAPRRLAVGHGRTLADPRVAIDRAIVTAEKKFDG